MMPPFETLQCPGIGHSQPDAFGFEDSLTQPSTTAARGPHQQLSRLPLGFSLTVASFRACGHFEPPIMFQLSSGKCSRAACTPADRMESDQVRLRPRSGTAHTHGISN